MYRIGVDLGGTNIAAGLVDENNKLVYKNSIKTGKGKDTILQNVCDAVLSIIKETNTDVKQISYVGIGVPATCDYEEGIIKYATNLGFENVNIREIVTKATGLPVYIENDGNAAALGEAVAGAGFNHKSTLMITLGTGIGVGVVLNDKLVKGDVEAGHHIINIGGPVCGCGNHGCFEAFCSATALIRDAKELATKHNNTSILKFAKDIDSIEAKNVFEAADSGDELFLGLIDEYICHLAIGINNLVNTYPVEAVILGGGVGQRKELLDPIHAQLKKIALGGAVKPVYNATLGNDAGILGAAFIND